MYLLPKPFHAVPLGVQVLFSYHVLEPFGHSCKTLATNLLYQEAAQEYQPQIPRTRVLLALCPPGWYKLVPVPRCFLLVLSTVLASFAAQGENTLIFTETELPALGHVPPEAQFIRVNDAGTLAVCTIKHDNQEFVTINGKVGPLFDWTGYLSFVDGETHVEYPANRGRKYMGHHHFPPMEGGKWFKVVDQSEQSVDNFAPPPFDHADRNIWQATSADGKKLAVVVQEAGKSWVSVNGSKGDPYDGVLWPVFSPDGNRLAYEADRRNPENPRKASFVVVDKMEEPIHEQVLRDLRGSTIRFSPDSKHYTYATTDSGYGKDEKFGYTHCMVLDGHAEERSNYQVNAPNPVFSGDSHWLIYGNSVGYSYTMTVRGVDGTARAESPSYQQVWLPHDQTGSTLHFFGLRDQTFYRVEVNASE